MYVTGARCLKCDDVIYSRHRMDMRFCSCGTISVYGGYYFFQVDAINGDDWEAVEELYVDGSSYKLHRDFLDNKNKYGVTKWSRLRRSKEVKKQMCQTTS